MHTSNSVWSRTARPDSRFWMVFSWQSEASASSACVIFFSIIAVLISEIDKGCFPSVRMSRRVYQVYQHLERSGKWALPGGGRLGCGFASMRQDEGTPEQN